MSSEEKPNPESPADAPPDEAEQEKFPRGRVMRFFPQSRYGFIKDKNGRDVYFNLDEVRFVGDKDHRELREGMEVGYDTSWTGHGRHIIRMKIY